MSSNQFQLISSWVIWLTCCWPACLIFTIIVLTIMGSQKQEMIDLLTNEIPAVKWHAFNFLFSWQFILWLVSDCTLRELTDDVMHLIWQRSVRQTGPPLSPWTPRTPTVNSIRMIIVKSWLWWLYTVRCACLSLLNLSVPTSRWTSRWSSSRRDKWDGRPWSCSEDFMLIAEELDDDWTRSWLSLFFCLKAFWLRLLLIFIFAR